MMLNWLKMYNNSFTIIIKSCYSDILLVELSKAYYSQNQIVIILLHYNVNNESLNQLNCIIYQESFDNALVILKYY